MSRTTAKTLALVAAGVTSLLACGSDDAETATCAPPLVADCAPLYEPTYDNLFERTFNPTCGVGGSSCHQSGGDGTKGGLTFDNPERTYKTLLDASRSWRLVDTSKPECSKVVYKITSHDMHVVMPPGRPLVLAEQCVIEKWIQKGAPR